MDRRTYAAARRGFRRTVRASRCAKAPTEGQVPTGRTDGSFCGTHLLPPSPMRILRAFLPLLLLSGLTAASAA